ncbi:MAG: DUF559 domain-containing protein [Anaerolineae bacterium]|nr:DUF559 domain-containing protein [Anaerolineae bacterium]
MAERVDVMISSTARDLPVHRKEAMDACLRQGMFPIMMEHLPASDDEAISVSLGMVDEAEIYMGIFAYRYGYIPKGHEISVTEMEYSRAVERKIPRLIFVMGEDHDIKGADVEKGDGATKLETFKNRVQTENIVNFFDSPADLRAKIIDSLSKTDLRQQRRDITNLHSPLSSDIPLAPKPYIAHPYTLLQTAQLAGRQAELNLLTDWVAKPSSPIYQARILNVVAIGGMGKSALTWKWFNDVAPLEMKSLAGRLWWSFYESDARFENFVTRALAYVSRRPREEIEKLSVPEREEKLLNLLDTEPFLLVLDGLERILIAYARMDAAYLRDDDLDEQTANFVTQAYGLPESAAQSFVGQHRLRKTADPRAGYFLRKLAAIRASRILVSTRLYPAELQTVTGGSIPSSAAIFLKGLKDDDALDLWRAMGVSGSRDALLPLFHRFENYPLLIRALAGVVANYKRAPGDFDSWRRNNPDFNPLSLPLANVKSHVLSFALADLDDKAKKVLHTVAAFRMAASYDTLASVLVGKEALTPSPSGRVEQESRVNPFGFASDESEGVERFRERAAELMVKLAQELRKKQTNAEERLGECLRDRRLNDIKFRRQHPIADTTFIADFFCYESNLVIEVDGRIHDDQQESDAARQQEIESLGYRVLRFRNEQIFNDLETVLASIAAACIVSPRDSDSSRTTSQTSGLSQQDSDSPRPEGEGLGVRVSPKPFPTETALDAALVELEDRGLIGWDKSANRYDLHPIVRGVTWEGLDGDGKRGVYENLHAHFEAVPNEFNDYTQVNSLEDLAPAIELYNTLIGLGRYEDAYIVFRDRLDEATLYRLSASQQRAELLEMLFLDGLDQLPRLSDSAQQAFTLNALALAYDISGQPGGSAAIHRKVVQMDEEQDNIGKDTSVTLCNLSNALHLAGGLHEAEAAARRALVITREQQNRVQEAISLRWLGLALAARNHGNAGVGEGLRPARITYSSEIALRRSLQMFVAQNLRQSEGLVNALLAQAALWRGNASVASPLADRAWELAHHSRYERDFIRAARLQGAASLGLGDLKTADERLHHALTRARAVNLVEEELRALVALAELHRQRGGIAQARERLDEIWESAERGPYPLIHGDALNVLAQIEIDAGNRDKAVESADKAYRLAWCDGISADGKTCYAYWWGLERARKHLESLGAPIPNDLLPFDESQFDPLPEVEINPKDEFWVDEDNLSN